MCDFINRTNLSTKNPQVIINHHTDIIFFKFVTILIYFIHHIFLYCIDIFYLFFIFFENNIICFVSIL